jgi:hypothetical protein
MAMNQEVTTFLESLCHPFRQEIEMIREYILQAHPGLQEVLKWNAPSFKYQEIDCITLQIMPPKAQVQIVFHRGAKVQEMPAQHFIQDESKLMSWKSNDRAVIKFTTHEQIVSSKAQLQTIVMLWIDQVQTSMSQGGRPV